MKLHYKYIQKEKLKGGRPLLVFLHEGLGSIGQWKGFPELLSTRLGLAALVYDRHGYGMSAMGTQVMDEHFLQREAWQFLPELIQHLQITNPIILFGHSDGGTIALLQAAQPMNQLLGCIVEAPHVVLEKESFEGIRSAREMLNSPTMIERFSFYHGQRSRTLIDSWTAMWLRYENEVWDMKEDLRKIMLPLCLIQGDEDNFGTFEQLEITKEHASSKHVEIHKLLACGHSPHLQKAQEVLSISEKFITRLLQE